MAETVDGYVPIAGYALIGCTRPAALVSRGGSIDWLCWPRFDSPSIFGRLLDAGKGGFFAIRPSVTHTATRRYLETTNVIETTFTIAGCVKACPPPQLRDSAADATARAARPSPSEPA